MTWTNLWNPRATHIFQACTVVFCSFPQSNAEGLIQIIEFIVCCRHSLYHFAHVCKRRSARRTFDGVRSIRYGKGIEFVVNLILGITSIYFPHELSRQKPCWRRRSLNHEFRASDPCTNKSLYACEIEFCRELTGVLRVIFPNGNHFINEMSEPDAVALVVDLMLPGWCSSVYPGQEYTLKIPCESLRNTRSQGNKVMLSEWSVC